MNTGYPSRKITSPFPMSTPIVGMQHFQSSQMLQHVHRIKSMPRKS